ncbi:hypothetical protein ACOME3_003732 [Neoechinorhynchus agilis]
MFTAYLLLLPILVNGLFFDIRETDEKCFIEEIPEDTQVVGKYRLQMADPQSRTFVDGDTKFGIFVQVRDPDNKEMMNKLYTSSGQFTFTSHTAGEHVICLKTNSSAWFGGSTVRVHLDIAIGEHTIDYEKVGVAEKLSELQLRLRQLIDQAAQIAKEQNYQRTREEHFRQLSQTINGRVFRWSIAQLCVLLIIGFWQMKHLRGFFQAKKLV